MKGARIFLFAHESNLKQGRLCCLQYVYTCIYIYTHTQYICLYMYISTYEKICIIVYVYFYIYIYRHVKRKRRERERESESESERERERERERETERYGPCLYRGSGPHPRARIPPATPPLLGPPPPRLRVGPASATPRPPRLIVPARWIDR